MGDSRQCLRKTALSRCVWVRGMTTQFNHGIWVLHYQAYILGWALRVLWMVSFWDGKTGHSRMAMLDFVRKDRKSELSFGEVLELIASSWIWSHLGLDRTKDREWKWTMIKHELEVLSTITNNPFIMLVMRRTVHSPSLQIGKAPSCRFCTFGNNSCSSNLKLEDTRWYLPHITIISSTINPSRSHIDKRSSRKEAEMNISWLVHSSTLRRTPLKPCRPGRYAQLRQTFHVEHCHVQNQALLYACKIPPVTPCKAGKRQPATKIRAIRSTSLNGLWSRERRSDCKLSLEYSLATMMRNKLVSSMQKTYDECYLICSTAVFFESQVGWKTGLVSSLLSHDRITMPKHYDHGAKRIML